MEKYVQRDIYLQKLIDSRLNGDVKVVTGPRRCGKSWLLTRLYKDFLIADGVPEEDIIIVSLDLDDENNQSELADKDKLKDYLYSRITDPSKTYYVMLDEIQEVDGFEKLVNGLRNKEYVDVYVTGSNAKLLSKEISTIFRDRGHEIRCNPFSFKEFCSGRAENLRELWQEYYTYGGMPGLRRRKTRLQKAAYLQELWRKTYMTDIRDRYPIENETALEALTDGLCSSIGSLSNSNKIANSLKSIRNIKINEETVKKYLDYICDSFLFEGALRFNIKGKDLQFCIKAIQDFAYSDFGGRGGKHGDIFWDNESYAIKHYLKMFAELASATLKQVADWFVWLASTLGRFNANELRRADHEVHDIADGRYDGRIQKYQQGLTR